MKEKGVRFTLSTDEVVQSLIAPELIAYEKRLKSNRGIDVAWERAREHYLYPKKTHPEDTYTLDKSGNDDIGHIYRIALMMPKVIVPKGAEDDVLSQLYNKARNDLISIFFHDIPERDKDLQVVLREKEHTDKRFTVIDYTLDLMTIIKDPANVTQKQMDEHYFNEIKKRVKLYKLVSEAIDSGRIDIKQISTEIKKLGRDEMALKVRSFLTKGNLGDERKQTKVKGELKLIRASVVNFMKIKLGDQYENLSNIRIHDLSEKDKRKATEKYFRPLAHLENEMRKIASEHGLATWFFKEIENNRAEAWSNIKQHVKVRGEMQR